jgi:hypothetical protein
MPRVSWPNNGCDYIAYWPRLSPAHLTVRRSEWFAPRSRLSRPRLVHTELLGRVLGLSDPLYESRHSPKVRLSDPPWLQGFHFHAGGYGTCVRGTESNRSLRREAGGKVPE